MTELLELCIIGIYTVPLAKRESCTSKRFDIIVVENEELSEFRIKIQAKI